MVVAKMPLLGFTYGVSQQNPHEKLLIMATKRVKRRGLHYTEG